MSKDKHIDNISEKVWKAYFSGVILTSDKERVESFLKQYPELEEEFKNVSSADAASISKITKNVNSRIDSKTGSKKSPVLWIGVVASIAIILVVVLNYQNNSVVEVAENDGKQDNVVSSDSLNQHIVESDNKIVEEAIDDTMFFFEVKGGGVEVVELLPEIKIKQEHIIIEDEPSDIAFIDAEGDEDIIETDEDIILPKVFYKKNFTTSIDYRQTVHVEDNFYSQSKTMGKTTSYASPIKGYSYEIDGMPNFKGGDEELLLYINNELLSDELMNGMRRKMKASLSFVVTNKGKIKDVLVQNCNHRQFGMSLMQIMENMPDWNPSDFKGKKGKVHYVLKIVFE